MKPAVGSAEIRELLGGAGLTGPLRLTCRPIEA